MFPTRLIRLATLSAMLFAGGFARAESQELRQQDDSADTVPMLLQKRRAVLSQLLKVETEAYRTGAATITELFQTQKELLQVDLELAESRQQRIGVLEKAVKLAMELEKLAQVRYKTGQATQADILRCQAETLRVKTDLLRARQ